MVDQKPYTHTCDEHVIALGGLLSTARIERIGEGGRRVVLVVEDDESVRAFLESALELRGGMVLAAVNGVEARRIARSWQFDVALVDAGLPDVDGEALARELAGLHPRANVVVMSAEPRPGRLVKPLQLVELWRIAGL